MSARSKDILIVEDSITQAEQLKYFLLQNGYNPSVVNNGVEALEFLKSNKPHLIISDIVMPVMDGYEFCESVKTDSRLKQIPVILITSLNEARDIIKGLQVGADSFIKKPYDEKYLLARINYILTNFELRKREKVQLGMEISLGGERHFISSERQQILDLLISTYEQAVQINGELKRSYHTLGGLYNIARELNKCSTEKDVLNKALEEGIKLPGIKAGWILLKESSSKHRLAAKKGLPPEFDNDEFYEPDCNCWRKLIAGELDRVTNILQCERLQKTNANNHGILYHASVPLWSGEETLGVMNLVGSEKDLFTDEEMETFFAVGNQIGTALERARLVENLENLIKERTKALMESEIWFHTVFNSQKDAVFVISKDRTIMNMNNAAEKMFGYSLNEIRNKSTEILHVDKEHYDIFGRKIFESLKRDDAARFEFPFKKKNGEIFPTEHAVSFIKDGTDNITAIIIVVRDITERKKTEESLQKAQQQLRVIIDNVPVIFFSLDKDGIFTLSEGKGLEKLGLKPGEVIGQSVFELYRDNFQVLENINKTLSGEICSFIAEANELAFDTRYFPLKDKMDNTIGLFGAAVDITERRRAEKEREQAEKILHLLSNAMQSVNECVSITDENDNMIFVNEAFEKTYGYTREELQGKAMAMFRSDRNPKEIVASILPATLKGGWQGEIFNKRKDGTEFPIWLSTSVVKDKDGKFIALIGVARDITQQKKDEEERNRLIAILESTSDFVGMADKEGRALYLNRGGRIMVGIGEEEDITGLPIILGHPESMRSFILNEVLPKAAQEGIWNGETILLHREGHEIPVLQIMIAHKTADGEVQLYSTIARDITEIKAIENELIAAKEKAEEMNRVKTNFFANMSHELRTPFVGIIGFAEILAANLTNHEDKELAEGIYESSKRLTETLNKILDVTKLEFKKTEIKLVNVDVETIVDEEYKLFKKAAEKKNLFFKKSIICKLPLIRSDEQLIREIINNLVSNAIKYTHNGGIEISLDKISKSEKDHLLIKVTDTGIGIPKHKQSIIWEEFRQVSEGHSRSFEGTGLGLTITKKYVELLNGNIQLDSEEGKGSTFVVEIPIEIVPDGQEVTSPKTEGKEKKSSVKPLQGTTKKVLYIEDDKYAREAVGIKLSNIYELDFAESADKAIQKIHKNSYDAILMDINLGGGMDGLELTNRIKNIEKYQNIPIIAVTAYAKPEDKDEFLSKGITHYIAKPFLLDDLKILLDEALKK
ncbi:MAG: PAS domain S-box protein [Bacteroidota bacterium]